MVEKLETKTERDLRLEKLREDTIKRDLVDMPSEKVFLIESKKTREWFCSSCGGPIPCSIDCPQCGSKRPKGNWDVDIEGTLGKWRASAKARK